MEDIGITPDRCLVVDQLHALSLGVLKYFLMSLVWLCFDTNVFDVHETTEDARLVTNVARLRAALFAWYKRDAARGRHHSRVQELTVGMVGVREAPDLRLHAAEMNGFLHFAGELLQAYGSLLPEPELWKKAQVAFSNMTDLVHQHRVVFPDRVCQATRATQRSSISVFLPPHFKSVAMFD